MAVRTVRSRLSEENGVFGTVLGLFSFVPWINPLGKIGGITRDPISLLYFIFCGM